MIDPRSGECRRIKREMKIADIGNRIARAAEERVYKKTLSSMAIRECSDSRRLGKKLAIIRSITSRNQFNQFTELSELSRSPHSLLFKDRFKKIADLITDALPHAPNVGALIQTCLITGAHLAESDRTNDLRALARVALFFVGERSARSALNESMQLDSWLAYLGRGKRAGQYAFEIAVRHTVEELRPTYFRLIYQDSRHAPYIVTATRFRKPSVLPQLVD